VKEGQGLGHGQGPGYAEASRAVEGGVQKLAKIVWGPWESGDDVVCEIGECMMGWRVAGVIVTHHV